MGVFCYQKGKHHFFHLRFVSISLQHQKQNKTIPTKKKKIVYQRNTFFVFSHFISKTIYIYSSIEGVYGDLGIENSAATMESLKNIHSKFALLHFFFVFFFYSLPFFLSFFLSFFLFSSLGTTGTLSGILEIFLMQTNTITLKPFGKLGSRYVQKKKKTKAILCIIIDSPKTNSQLLFHSLLPSLPPPSPSFSFLHFQRMSSILSTMPYMVTVGNHEKWSRDPVLHYGFF